MSTTSRIARSFVAALVGSLIGASTAPAQCLYPHGQPTGGNGWARLTQAFVPCGGLDCDGFAAGLPNSSTIGGLPSCTPTKTYHQYAGSPLSGWRLDTASGRARFRLDGQNGPNVRIRVQLVDIRDANGPGYAPIGSTGSAYLVLRFTTNDAGVDMTVIDFPLLMPLTITNGTGDGLLDTTINAQLASLGLPPLSPCTNVELLEVAVFDPNSNKFLRPGHFRF